MQIDRRLALTTQLTAAVDLRVNDAAWRLLSDGPLGKQGAPEREARLTIYNLIMNTDRNILEKSY